MWPEGEREEMGYIGGEVRKGMEIGVARSKERRGGLYWRRREGNTWR